MIDKYKLLKIFRQYLESKINISESNWKRIAAITQIVYIPRNKHLLRTGEIYDKHVFILKGCLRTYFINSSTGKESTLIFKCENSWANEHESLFSRVPSRFNIDAIENSWVAVINDVDFAPIAETLPGLQEHIRDLFLKCFIESNQRIHAAYFMDATERYNHMLSKNPEIILRVPQIMVASYLRINAETLSRIKRKTARQVQPKTDYGHS